MGVTCAVDAHVLRAVVVIRAESSMPAVAVAVSTQRPGSARHTALGPHVRTGRLVFSSSASALRRIERQCFACYCLGESATSIWARAAAKASWADQQATKKEAVQAERNAGTTDRARMRARARAKVAASWLLRHPSSQRRPDGDNPLTCLRLGFLRAGGAPIEILRACGCSGLPQG